LQATYPLVGAMGLRERAMVESALAQARFRLRGDNRMTPHVRTLAR
jgi:hypothetical protein